MGHLYYVYILANKKNGTLYIGVTGNLVKRIYEHKEKRIEGFSKKYGVDKLVYFEQTQNVHGAMEREKRLKKWKRQWKIELIEKKNPEWQDLYDVIIGNDGPSIKTFEGDKKLAITAGAYSRESGLRNGNRMDFLGSFL